MFDCPNCGASLGLSLKLLSQEESKSQPIASERFPTIRFTLGGRIYESSRYTVEETIKNYLPKPGRMYFVELMSRNGIVEDFPIKQALRETLRTQYGDEFIEENFTAQRVKGILEKMGFKVFKRQT